MNYMINMAQCLKASNGFGSTTFFNVCDKTSQIVPWGTLDWVNFGFGVALFGVVMSGFAALSYGIVKTIYEEYA